LTDLYNLMCISDETLNGWINIKKLRLTKSELIYS
jgi:hypothetical protein